jgi:catechol 2,3-dioxygenase
MTTDAADQLLANRTPIRMGGIGLRVRDLQRMTAFYRDVIGLTILREADDSVDLGAGGVLLVTLERHGDAAIEPRRSAGLFHTAFLMPTRRDLARWLVHAGTMRVPLTGVADHLVSEAIYLDDPEGNGVEVYADRPPESWVWTDGVVTMGTDPLDIDDLMSLTDRRADDFTTAPDGLRIGHIHLRVGDIARANDFYRTAVGLEPTFSRRDATFLSSGGYHHHVAVNIWQSAGAGRRDDATTGLAWFCLEVASPEILAAQELRFRQAGWQVTATDGGIEAIDPWGTKLRLVSV